jgi:hypothetical protein
MSAIRHLLPFRTAGAETTAISLSGALTGLQPGTSGELFPGRAALLGPAEQEQAEGRLAAIQPLLDYDVDPGRFAHLRLTDGTSVTSKSLLAEHLSEKHGVSKRTLFGWQRTYREGGLPALADRQRSDKGRSRWFESNRNAAWVAAYLHLECRQSYRAVHEALVANSEALALAELPSYETVRAWLSSAPACLRAYALQGRRAYQERMAPYLSRGYTDVASNQIWVSDHALHDAEVLNDCFPELEFGAPMRLRITCLIDFRSRYVVGASWCPEGSSRSIATAMRRAIAQHGPCSHFYCDNGKDYLKVARGAVPAYLRDPEAIAGWSEREMARIERVGILARLGIRVTHCIVRHPQSKHVERFFRTMHEQFDRRWHQHYTGGAPHLRPDATSAAMMLHRKLARHGRVNESTHPPASLFIALAMGWIEEYHGRPHSGRGMEGATPAEIFAERPAMSSTPVDALALLMEEQTRLKVRECAVEWTPVPKGGKRRFTFFDEASRDTLHMLNEQHVIVAYDPNDLDTVALLDESGHFLCWAKAEQYLRMDPADPGTQQQIADSMRDRRHLEKTTRNVIAEISRNARAIGARTPVESLAARTPLAPVIESALTHRSPKPQPSSDAKAPLTATEIAANFWRD